MTRHLWVLLSALPLSLWSKEVLVGIANSLKRFVALDEHFLHSYDKCSTRVLVELNVFAGLSTNLDIILHDRVYV